MTIPPSPYNLGTLLLECFLLEWLLVSLCPDGASISTLGVRCISQFLFVAF